VKNNKRYCNQTQQNIDLERTVPDRIWLLYHHNHWQCKAYVTAMKIQS